VPVSPSLSYLFFSRLKWFFAKKYKNYVFFEGEGGGLSEKYYFCNVEIV
jgi:hypothetical protein